MKPVERRAFSGDSAQELTRLQDAVIKAVNPIAAKEILDGVLLTAVTLTTSFSNVTHGLGRKYRGWILVGIDANATVWEDSTAVNTDLFITMRASAACNVKLWVF